MKGFSWTRRTPSTFLATILGPTASTQARGSGAPAPVHAPPRDRDARTSYPAIGWNQRQALTSLASPSSRPVLPFGTVIVDARQVAFISQVAPRSTAAVTFENFAGLAASRSSFLLESQTDAAFGGHSARLQVRVPRSQSRRRAVHPPAFAFRTGEFAETSDSGQDPYAGNGGPDAGSSADLFRADFMPMFLFESVARPVASPTEDDNTFAGPLPLDDATDESLSLLTNQPEADRSDLNAVNFIASGRSVPMNLNVEPSTMDWTSYLAGWDSQQPLAELTDTNAAPFVLDDTSDQPEPPASISAGEAPLGFLLRGPDLPDQTSPPGESQVAELVPSSESSLALTATLWTISSDPRTSCRRQWPKLGSRRRAWASRVTPLRR